jgi:hypothetical protein
MKEPENQLKRKYLLKCIFIIVMVKTLICIGIQIVKD